MNWHQNACLNRLASAGACALLALPAPGLAQSADNPPNAQRAHTLKAPSRDSKTLGSIERGTGAAGRGIDRAGEATERAVNTTAERASAPVRRLGESFGRKLAPHSNGKGAQPRVGPQGNSP